MGSLRATRQFARKWAKVKWFQRLWLAALSCVGCSAPVDADSAFESERFLCDDAHAAEFEARVEECRQARAAGKTCVGLVSVKGVIDAEPVVFDAPAVTAVYTDTVTGSEVSRRFSVVANAPYFSFTLATEFQLDRSTGLLSVAADPISATIINVEARGGNYFTSLLNPTRAVEQPAPDEVRATFSAALSRGGFVDGCFDIFPAHR